MAVQAAQVKAGALLGGVGVHLSPQLVHLHGQLLGGAAGGALEGHVLDEVGRSALPRLLVAGAGAHKNAQGGGAHAGDLVRQDAHAVGQGDGLMHGSASFLENTGTV